MSGLRFLAVWLGLSALLTPLIGAAIGTFGVFADDDPSRYVEPTHDDDL